MCLAYNAGSPYRRQGQPTGNAPRIGATTAGSLATAFPQGHSSTAEHPALNRKMMVQFHPPPPRGKFLLADTPLKSFNQPLQGLGRRRSYLPTKQRRRTGVTFGERRMAAGNRPALHGGRSMSSGVAGDAHAGSEEAKVLADNGTVTGASEICHIIGVQFPCPASHGPDGPEPRMAHNLRKAHVS